MTPEDCFYKRGVLLDLFKVVKFMQERGYGDLYDDLMEAGGSFWPSWHVGHNDSFWHAHRNWMPSDRGRYIWDLICLELNLGDPEEALLIFWVSW